MIPALFPPIHTGDGMPKNLSMQNGLEAGAELEVALAPSFAMFILQLSA